MATDYAIIISTLDAAIAAGAASPLTIAVNNRQYTYRGLDQLVEARKYYVALAAATARDGRPIGIAHLKCGGPQ